MSIELNGSTGIDFNDGSNQSTSATPYGRKNLIINGDMRIAQRGTSETGVITTGYYTVDRWQWSEVGTSVVDFDQVTDAPTGFQNSFKITIDTADTKTTNESIYSRQVIEGLNSAHLLFGTANAKTVTISFWVKSSLTGTYSCSLHNDDFNRAYVSEYTVSSANTWEKKTITVEGDTTGTWKTDNDRGLIVQFPLGGGPQRITGANAWASTNANITSNCIQFCETAGATWQITGVQLEVGDAASDFEFMPYDMELARCQRYYYQQTLVDPNESIINVACYTGSNAYAVYRYPVPMRASPSLVYSDTGDFEVLHAGVKRQVTLFSVAEQSSNTIQLETRVASGFTGGHAGWLRGNNSFTPDGTQYFGFDAEL